MGAGYQHDGFDNALIAMLKRFKHMDGQGHNRT